MKTKIILLLFLIAFTFSAYSQSWQWAVGAGGPSLDEGTGICVDNQGNIYVVGSVIENDVIFGSEILNSNGFNDLFLAKYDSTGQQLWVKLFGGHNAMADFETSGSISYNESTNSLYWTGAYIGSCIFGSYTLTAYGPSDHQIFLVKMNTDGDCIWAKSAGGSGWDNGTSLTFLNGSILLAAHFGFSGAFGTHVVGAGGAIAMYDDSGNCLWAKSIFEGTLASITSISIFNSDIIAYGSARDSTTVDTINLYAPSNYWGRILARIDTAGHVKWANLIGGPKVHNGIDCYVDHAGNSYFINGFLGPIAALGNDSIHTTSQKDFYIAKYNQQGQLVWVRQGNVNGRTEDCSVCSDHKGGIYVTGSFSGSANFGTGNIYALSDQDGFIARYDSLGNCLGVRTFANGLGISITSDSNSNAFITGQYRDTTYIGTSMLIANGTASDVLIAKISEFTGTSGRVTYKSTENSELMIYANPNGGKCTIEVPEEFTHKETLILSIYNNQGRLIQQQQLSMVDGKIKLNLEGEARGMYIATLTNGKKFYTGKIVFE